MKNTATPLGIISMLMKAMNTKQLIIAQSTFGHTVKIAAKFLMSTSRGQNGLTIRFLVPFAMQNNH